MVDMGVAQHHGIERGHVEGQFLVIERLERAGALKQPAIEQDP